MDTSNTSPGKITWTIIIIAFVITALVSLKGCGSHEQPGNKEPKAEKPGSVDMPASYAGGKFKAALLIPEDSTSPIVVLDSEGNVLEGCRTCTPDLEEKYGEGCRNKPDNSGICGLLKPAVPIEGGAIPFYHARASSCWYVYPQSNRLIGVPYGCTPF